MAEKEGLGEEGRLDKGKAVCTSLGAWWGEGAGSGRVGYLFLSLLLLYLPRVSVPEIAHL